jgi:hypothetical protein
MTDIPELTDAEKLAALGTYIKVLTAMERDLRTAVEKDMGTRHVEKVGAYLPNGTKMASVSRSEGKRTVKVDEVAALKWCQNQYPGEVVAVEMIRPAFMKKLVDIAGSLPVGSKGLDSKTGEELPFITVMQGSPYVSITTTSEGVETMTALAHGFAGMLEGPKHGPGQGPAYDPGFADRLENGGYR